MAAGFWPLGVKAVQAVRGRPGQAQAVEPPAGQFPPVAVQQDQDRGEVLPSQPIQAPVPAAATAPPVTYTVQPGDTLWSIARRHQLTAATLAAANGLADPNQLKPGQVLRVPGGGEVVHVVRAGETLWDIALRYGLEVDAIANLNQLGDSSFLRVGQRLQLPVARSSEPDPEAAERRRVAALAASAGVLSDSDWGGFRWPLTGRITSPFGPRDGHQHTGIDIAAGAGTPIRASKAGVVSVANWVGGYGLAVVVRHDDGTATLYGHASKLLVEKGQKVDAGQTIALVGSTGNSTGPHLHFEVIVSQKPQDPLQYLPSN